MSDQALTSVDDPLWKDALAGAVAGLAATAAIAIFMQVAQRIPAADPSKKDEKGEPQVGSPEAATRAVDVLAQTAAGKPVPEEKQEAATGGFQFAFGAALGIAYGLAARFVPAVTAGRGTAAGAAIFGAFDEVLVPATGLSGKPWHSPAKAHIGALTSHFVFGTVMELVRRSIRR